MHRLNSERLKAKLNIQAPNCNVPGPVENGHETSGSFDSEQKELWPQYQRKVILHKRL